MTQQLMFKQGLNRDYKLILDQAHFLSLLEATPEDHIVAKGIHPTVGDVLEAVLDKHTTSNELYKKYEDHMAPLRSETPKEDFEQENPGGIYRHKNYHAETLAFCEANGILVTTNPKPPVFRNLDVSIDPKFVAGNLRTLITFGETWLAKITYGETRDSKLIEEFNLDVLHEQGLVPALINDQPHKLNALACQVARLHLSALQALIAFEKDPSRYAGIIPVGN